MPRVTFAVRAVRALGFLAAALALSASFAAPAVAQGDPQTVNEVLRKADTRESEAGFCATTGWRVETPETLASNTQFYDVAQVGSAKTFIDTEHDYCAYLRIEEIYTQAGQRCLRIQMWSCGIGRVCSPTAARGCRGDRMYNWQ